MVKRLLLAILLLLLVFRAVAIANEEDIQTEVNARVSQLVELLLDPYAVEYKKARGIQIFKIWKEDVLAVAVFSIEGYGLGNNWTQFMAVFSHYSSESEGHPKRLTLLDVMAVGGKDTRSLKFDQIMIQKTKNGKLSGILITVPALEVGPNDPLCCPSVETKVRVAFNPYGIGERLKEIK